MTLPQIERLSLRQRLIRMRQRSESQQDKTTLRRAINLIDKIIGELGDLEERRRAEWTAQKELPSD